MTYTNLYLIHFQNGLLNALPQMAIYAYGIIFSFLSDFLLSREYVKKPILRYFMHAIGFGMPGITIAALGYSTENWIVCIAVLSLGIGFRGAQYMGHLGAVYDVAPKYSGTVYGVVNMIGNTPGFITPLVTTAFTGDNPKDVAGWRHLFWLSASLFFSGFVAFPAVVRLIPASFESETQEISQDRKNYGTVDNSGETHEL